MKGAFKRFYIMKRKLSLVVFLLLLSLTVMAQPTVPNVLKRLPERTLPFVGYKNVFRDKGASGISFGDYEFDDRLYTNVQLTQWDNACMYDAELPSSAFQFLLPDTDKRLLLVTLGGVTDYKTDVLLVVTPDGQIYDQLLVGVMTIGKKGEYMPVVQYQITEDAKVIVYRLQPTASESIPLGTFTSFTANRYDTTYEIGSDGKFKSVKTTKYRPRTYTREKLVDLNYNIWTGNELPMRSVENRN